MKYDFETSMDRSNVGSAKWEQMKAMDPEASPGVVPFSVADMELKNPPEVVEGLKAFLDTAILGYTVPTPDYLASVCRWMDQRHGWKVRPEWILGSPGVVSAIFSAIKAITAPGDGIIIQTPVYYPFFNAVRKTHRTLVRNPLLLTDGRYGIDYQDLERKASDPKNKVLLFCSPHNPVGRVWTPGELARVGEICLRNKVLIISDEIHFDLVMPGHRHTVFATVSEALADAMIVCTSPSKTFNLAGMHTSNIIIANPELRAAFQKEGDASGFFSLGILGYEACRIAYTRCGPWLEELLTLIHGNHVALKAFIGEHLPAIKVFDLEGTYLQWMDFRGLGLDPAELERFLHRDAQLFLNEGHAFGEEGSGFERMNLACPARTLMDGLGRLAGAVRRRGGTGGEDATGLNHSRPGLV